MQNARLFTAGAVLGLCLCAMAKADEDEFQFRTAAKPVVVRRVIVVSGHRTRVIYVRPAYRVHSVVPVNRSEYLNSENETHNRDVEMSDSNVRDSDNHVFRATKTGREGDTNQSEQAQVDNNSRPVAHKSAVTQPEAEQPAAKQPVAKPSQAKRSEAKQQKPEGAEDDGALDRLTVQAQKEQAIHLAEPGGIEPR